MDSVLLDGYLSKESGPGFKKVGERDCRITNSTGRGTMGTRIRNL